MSDETRCCDAPTMVDWHDGIDRRCILVTGHGGNHLWFDKLGRCVEWALGDDGRISFMRVLGKEVPPQCPAIALGCP